nr:hypothetical protein NCPCFENI_00055 [Cupriavidus sp.]
MVLAEAGQRGILKPAAREAPLCQPNRAGLEDHIHYPLRQAVRKAALQADRIQTREARLGKAVHYKAIALPREPMDAQCPNSHCSAAHPGKASGEPLRDCGLSVGARHGRYPQLLRRTAVEDRGKDPRPLREARQGG